MLNTPKEENQIPTTTLPPVPPLPAEKQGKYKNIINAYQPNIEEVNYDTMDAILEKEKQHNKTEPWSKLDKIIKIQKLHQYAEKYGREHTFPAKDIKLLKTFFAECLVKNKLNKTKDVLYDKEKREIASIPALHFNSVSHNFTLKIIDTKRVSTLKSLTPKRVEPTLKIIDLENDEHDDTSSQKKS
jgi:hypothetical protein